MAAKFEWDSGKEGSSEEAAPAGIDDQQADASPAAQLRVCKIMNCTDICVEGACLCNKHDKAVDTLRSDARRKNRLAQFRKLEQDPEAFSKLVEDQVQSHGKRQKRDWMELEQSLVATEGVVDHSKVWKLSCPTSCFVDCFRADHGLRVRLLGCAFVHPCACLLGCDLSIARLRDCAFYVCTRAGPFGD